MTAPEFKIAVRDTAGKKALFKLQHEAVTDYKQAAELTKGEFPGATVLVLVPPVERELEGQAA